MTSLPIIGPKALTLTRLIVADSTARAIPSCLIPVSLTWIRAAWALLQCAAGASVPSKTHATHLHLLILKIRVLLISIWQTASDPYFFVGIPRHAVISSS